LVTRGILTYGWAGTILGVVCVVAGIFQSGEVLRQVFWEGVVSDLIPTLSQIITSLSAAVVTIVGVVAANGSKMKSLLRKVEKLDSKIDGVSLEVLRLAFHDERASVEERVDAGYKYLQLGGNGSTRADYEMLVEKYKGQAPLHNRRKGDVK
jgi:hypothetical protein